MNGKAQPTGCWTLTQAAVADVGRIIFHKARMPDSPMPYPPQNEPVTAKLVLGLYECELKAGTESVLGILGGTRLVYGEMRDGRFRFLSDSPQFGLLHYAGYISELRDMNGDGVKEILVEYDASGASVSYAGLAIFDIDGNELDPGDDSFIGESFQYETREDGKVDVLVVNNEGTDRYTLVNGRYALVKPAKHPPAKPHKP